MIPALPSTSAPNTFGPPEYYYCCSCRYGPMLSELHPSCIMCGHEECSGCNTDSIEGLANLTTVPPSSGPGSTTLVAYTPLTTDNSMTEHLPATRSPILCRDSLSEANIVSDIDGPLRNEKATDGGDYSWYCCQCNDGPHDYTVVPGCPTCDHHRCTSCVIVPRK